jgi:type IV pilus assembly protein PilE
MKTKYQHGFTLVELMIVVVIIAILAAVAYPSYTDYVRRGRRSDGKSALLATAQIMERYFTENTRYSGPTLGATSSNTAAATSPEQFYTIAFDSAPTSGTVCGASTTTSPSPTAYRLCATPTGAQASDTCGILSLSNTGVKTPSTRGCW